MTDIRDSLMVGRTSDGRLVRRPLSPHLQVYRLNSGMVMSITHRITGAALTVGTLLLTWWLAAAASGDAAYGAVSGFMRSWFGVLILLGWTAALWYHFFAGIRHLIWDTGRALDKPDAYRTGVAVLAGTAILTAITWIVGLVLL